MTIDLPLDAMTTPQKLEMMEALWDSLSKNPREVESPEWHAAVLDERSRRLASGEASISDWESAKERLRQRSQ